MYTSNNPHVPLQAEVAVPEQTLLTVREAARALRIGRNTCYEMIRQKQIPHVRLGRLIRVPRFGLESWIARQAGLPEAPPSVVSLRPQTD